MGAPSLRAPFKGPLKKEHPNRLYVRTTKHEPNPNRLASSACQYLVEQCESPDRIGV